MMCKFAVLVSGQLPAFFGELVNHILQPEPGKTLTQTYRNHGYKNDKGNTECVEFLKQTLGAPLTSLWREGQKIANGSQIAPGTPIATFVGGKYPQHGNTGMHAAIYLGQDAQGIQVLDQFRAQGMVEPRTIFWKPHKQGLSNDGKAFSVVQW